MLFSPGDSKKTKQKTKKHWNYALNTLFYTYPLLYFQISDLINYGEKKANICLQKQKTKRRRKYSGNQWTDGASKRLMKELVQ